MALRRTTGTRNAVAEAEGALLDGGSADIRTGSQTTTPNDAEDGTVLGTVGFSATAFGSASTGTVTAAAITSDTSADASGTAGKVVLKNSGGTKTHDATAGEGSGDFNFDNADIVAGGTIAISSLTLTAAQ